MQPFEKLEAGRFYHIYNHAVGKLDLFKDAQNYEHFLSLYDKYISPVADTYAWVLMKNHFHVMVRIKEGIVYKYSNSDRSTDAVGFSVACSARTRWPGCSRTLVGICNPDLNSKGFIILFFF